MLRGIAWLLILLMLAAVVAYFLGRVRFRHQVMREIEQLAATAPAQPAATVTGADLAGLPAPLQRYFRFTGVVGKPRPRLVHLTHAGVIRTKPDASWMPVHGEEYFSVNPPGFIWYAQMQTGPLNLISVRDHYVNGEGNVLVKLAGLFTVGDSGPNREINQSALLRYAGEAVWFPAALLMRDAIAWEPIDDASVRMIVHDHDAQATAILTFNERGELTQLFSNDRYRDATPEPWTVYCRHYRELAGVQIPTEVEVVWNQPAGDFSYAIFQVTALEFDPPHWNQTR